MRQLVPCMNILNMKNRYCHRSHISEKRFREIIRLFAMDMEASKIAEITGVSRNAVNRILKALRRRIAEWCEFDSPLPCLWESDEVVSGLSDSNEDEGQGALNDQRRTRRIKIPAIGIARHSEKIFTQMLAEYSRKEIVDIVQGKAPRDGGIRKEGFSSFHGIVDTGERNCTG
jgi:transposase